MGCDRHSSSEELEQYSIGALSEPEAAGLEEHLLVCPECQKQLEETDRYVACMRKATRTLITEPPPRHADAWQAWIRFLKGPAPIALMLVALAVVVVRVVLPLKEAPGPPPVAVALEATRGDGNATVQGGTRLSLVMDLSGVPEFPKYRTELVTFRGIQMLTGIERASNNRLVWTTPGPLGAGLYWVRILEPGPSGRLLREYGLNVK